MAFLTALLGGLGGFEQGRQQRRDYNLAAQQQADTHAYQQQEIADEKARTGIAQQEETATQQARQRNMGIDPTTGKPYVIPQPLTQVAPNNKGKAATPQQLYDHYSQLARYYISTGQTDAANIAANQAGDIQRQMIQANTIQAQNARDIYNQGHMDQRTAEIIAGANQRNVLTTDTSRENNENTVGQSNTNNLRTTDTSSQNNQRTTATSRANNAANVAQRYTSQSNNDLRQQQTQNDQATRLGQPLPHPELAGYKKNLTSAITAVTQNPKLLPTILKQFESHVTDPSLLMYARRQLQDAAREAQGQRTFLPVPPVGSPVNTPPPNLPNPGNP